VIVRQNWLDVNSYLDYHARTLLRSPKMIARERNYLCHLLEWAEATPFPNVAEIKPVRLFVGVANRTAEDATVSGGDETDLCGSLEFFALDGGV
jgi:hypothetical protein